MAPQQTAIDVLFDIRNSYLIGNYQHSINEAQKAKLMNPLQQLEKDAFMYRAYIAQHKYGVVINEIQPSSNAVLQSIKLLASYLAGNDDKKSEIVKSIESVLQSVEDPEQSLVCLMVGMIYYLEEDYDAVLRTIQNSENMECSALAIQTYLKINRTDLAQKEWNKMKQVDEDCTITQLCQAWVNLHKGGEKLQDAYYTFQELSDKYCSTPMLLNGQAAALIGMGKYDEADLLLQEAMDKDSNFPETFINMTVLSQYLGKPIEVSCRYLNQLKDSHPHHPFVKEYQNKEQEFERLSKQYAPTLA